MCLLRLKAPYDTDLLFTYNVPDKHTDEDESQSDVGQSTKYVEFLTQCEHDFYKTMVPSFVISGDQAVKDLLGM